MKNTRHAVAGFFSSAGRRGTEREWVRTDTATP